MTSPKCYWFSLKILLNDKETWIKLKFRNNKHVVDFKEKSAILKILFLLFPHT